MSPTASKKESQLSTCDEMHVGDHEWKTFSNLRAPAGTKWIAPKTVLLGAGGRGRKIRRAYAQNFEGKSAACRRVTSRLEKQITLQDGESNSPRIGASPSHSEVRDDQDRRSVVDRQAQNEHTPQELTERARDEQALHASTAGARKNPKGSMQSYWRDFPFGISQFRIV
jgi:hypothetical protein